MAIHRTAMGRAIDMSALQSKNEKVRAVGNMSVNARGDTIDSHGRIITPVTAKVNSGYAKTVSNRTARENNGIPRQVIKPDAPKPAPKVEEVVKMELTETELAMEAEFDDDELTEQIKKMELEQLKKGKK